MKTRRAGVGVLFVVTFLFAAFSSYRSRAAGTDIDFTLQFFMRTSATGGVISTRQFNTLTGPADGLPFFTGLRLVTTGNSNEWVGFENPRVLRVFGDGSAKV